MSTSALTLRTTEEEGLAHSLPPRIDGLYLGGRGSGPLPHNVSDFLGGGGTGPPPRMAGKYLEFEEQIWDAPAIPWSVGWSSTCTRVLVRTARDAPRYRTVGVLVVAGQVRAGLTTVGTLRRYIRLGRYGAAAQLGRSGDTMSCGLAFDLHTGAGRHRSGRFCDTMRCVGDTDLEPKIELCCRRSGRFGDTNHLDSVPLSTSGRSGDTMAACLHKRTYRRRSGHFCDTVRWCVLLVQRAHVG